MNHVSRVCHVLQIVRPDEHVNLTIELLFDHFDFVVAEVSVNVFQHHAVVIPPLVRIIFGYTTANTQVATNGCCIHAEVQTLICSLKELVALGRGGL